MASVKYIARMPEERRLAILTAFVKAQEILALDEAVDVLDLLILNIAFSEANRAEKRLRTLKILIARATSGTCMYAFTG
jgi:ABC-type dipeptide/oligopeptide/nickel transport system ATPase subunit